MYFSLAEEIKKYPFVRLIIPFILGIILALNYDFLIYIFYFLLIALFLIFIVFHALKKINFELFHGLVINLIIFTSGYLLTTTKLEISYNDELKDYQGYIIGKLSDDPIFRERSVRVNIDIEAIKQNDDWYKTSGRTMLYLSPDEKSKMLKSGSYIIFSPQLSEIKNSGNPEEFDYKKYLSYNFIHTSDFLNTDDWDFFGDKKSENIKYRMLNFRQKLIDKLEKSGLNDDELGVISALALGYRNRLSDELRHNYASSGAMHILAVSGLHVGIVYMIILFLLSFLKNKKLIVVKVILTILLIWFYAFLTGLSPSVSRAATMFSFIAASHLFKKSPGIFNSIAASAFLLLLINPLMLTQIGFQLSYLAVIGIVLIFPQIYPLFKFKNYLLDKIWSLTVVSVAAQIATAPIAIFYFNQMSNYFLITNYLLIPLATVAIYLTLTVFVFSPIIIISDFFAMILSVIVKTMNFFTSMIESLPGSVSTNLYINLPQLILFYLFIIFTGAFFFGSKRYRELVIAIVLLICFSSFSLLKNISRAEQEYLIVYNINRASAINIIDGKDNILFADFDKADRNQIEFSAKNNWLKLGLQNEKFIDLSQLTPDNILSNIAIIDNKKVFQKRNFIAFNDKRILFINKNFISPDIDTGNNEKIFIDYIVLSDNSNIKLESIAELFDFEQLIFDSSNTDWTINRWIEENITVNLPVHNVKTDGAFIAKL